MNQDIFFQLSLTAIAFLPSILLWSVGKEKYALYALLLAALVLRLVITSLDPYLNEWDERFHAVVAKNMMQYPLKPMIRLEALVPYRVDDWCCNYIWVHKQPLFLWQMALSMKVFGVNTIALRLPGAIMGTFMVYLLYRIAQIWTNNTTAAYLGALLFAAGYYNLELCSGAMPLDQNDLVMGAYVTASIWVFCEYSIRPRWRWVILAGIFAGCAVLTKWLTGLLVFGGWGIWLLFLPERRSQWRSWTDLLLSAGICAALFLPWQWYILHAFPAETAASYAHNIKHIVEDLGHNGTDWTHFAFMQKAYGGIGLLGLMGLGCLLSWRKPAHRMLSASMTAMFWVVYAFFSFAVATKMPGLTFPVAGIGFIWAGMGAAAVLHFLTIKWSLKMPLLKAATGAVAAALLGWYSFQPAAIAAFRSSDNAGRLKKLHNTALYQSLQHYVRPEEIIINCKTMEDTEVRFWQPNNAYHWWPQEKQLDSLIQLGYSFCAFKSHGEQKLPDFILQNPRVRILDLEVE